MNPCGLGECWHMKNNILLYSNTMNTNKLRQIGKGGMYTSFVLKKSLLKKLAKGGANECQDNINSEIDNKDKNTPPWLQIKSVLQNIKGKGIATVLGSIDTKDVVIKAQSKYEADKEFNTQQKLKDMSGFIQYTCLFTCEGNKSYIENFAFHGDNTRLCNAKGVTMGIIVMPFYKKSSLEDYLKTSVENDKMQKIKQCMIKVIENITNAFNDRSFTHGDLFSKNIVLDDEYNPIIIDFEKSGFEENNQKLSTFWRDLDDFLGDMSRYAFRQELDIISRIILINRAYGLGPSGKPIEDLLFALKNIQV